jgi:hypothetical protein
MASADGGAAQNYDPVAGTPVHEGMPHSRR